MSNSIPEDWSIAPIGDICNIAIGGTPSRSIPDYWDSTGTVGSPWVSIRDLNKPWIYETSEWITDAGIKNSNVKLVRKGTVIMSFKLSVGRVAFAGRDLYTNEAIAAFLPKRNNVYSDQFLYQGLQHWNLLENIDQAVKGVTLNKEKINQIEAVLPPLPEQQKIAAILSSVDDVIEKTRAQIDKLKDLKTGMMQELLTKGIGHTEFKDSPVGRIPASWDVRYISDLCSNIVDCVNKTAPVVDHVTPYRMIRTTNVRNGRIVMDGMRYVSQKTFQSWSRRLALKAGDLIFTREAPVGECGLVRDAKGLFLGQRTMVYRAASEKLDSGFLLWSMLSEYCQNQIEDLSGGSTTPHLRVPDCGKILLKVPPLAEQRGISSAIQSVATLLEERETKVAHLTGLKKALMQDLLTGKVRVNVGENETAVA